MLAQTTSPALETESTDMATADYALVAEAIQYLELNQTEQPSLDDLADHLHVSPFHLQRVFKRWAGISPKRFLQYLTVEHAKALLAASHSVLDATYAAGLSSPSRLHDLFVTVEAMTPGEFKDGGRELLIRYGVQPSPFGDCLLAMTGRGICGLAFINGAGVAGEVAQLRQFWPNASMVEDAAATAAVAQRIFAAPDSHLPQQREPVQLLLTGTNFQIRVWEALLRIPSGAVTTYADVAEAIGQPSAARAVGSAVGANHIAYLIPCHRVIRKNGLVRDYRWGSTRKKAMLGWESAHASGMLSF